MQKRVSIGQSDFKTVITKRYYIDKSLFIKDVIDGDTSQLITRPRRFGKTLNMTMLKYFYDIQEENSGLFKGLQIETEGEGKYMEKCGKHPVIYMTFKDLKVSDVKVMYASFIQILIGTFNPFIDILTDNKLPQNELGLFQRLYSAKTDLSDLQNLLPYACKILYNHYGTKVVVLIDEYDTPVIASYTADYYAQMVEIIRLFLGAGLKDNPYLEKGVLTGITRIAKESMFSGLNNFDMYSILERKMSDKFGFTEAEVHKLLLDHNLLHTKEEVKLWYNSYEFGKTDIYNPWSVLNFVNEEGENFKTYWVNTSENALVREVMFNKRASIRNDLDKLLRGEWIKIKLEENLSFLEIQSHLHAVWNLMLFGGYLKHRNINNEHGFVLCEVAVPNLELMSIFKRFVNSWIERQIRHSEHEDMLAALVLGEVQIFQKLFKRFVEAVFSFHDTAGDMPEKFYHSFLLGLMVKLEGEYHIFSNREIGFGRADICLIPKEDKTKLGIIIEIKSPDKSDKETLAMGLELAEKQIIEKKYAAIMPQYGIQDYIALAISVQGKKAMVKKVNIGL